MNRPNDMYQQFLNEAEALLPDVVALRREIHRLPELGNDTPLTRQAVLRSLDGIDLDFAMSEETSGMVATMTCGRPGPTILLRGDMDALPMTEESGVDFSSEIDGRMHSCGHDTHTAMLAGAVHLLNRHRDNLPGRIKFMFQPGEEGFAGARIMIEEGVLDEGGQPDRAFGMHIWPQVETGTMHCKAGPMLASADQIRIKLSGRGGHGSRPHESLDPIPVACEIVQALQTFVTRRVYVFDPVVLTVGRIQAGTASNIIPETAEMDITLRTLSAEARELAHAGIRRVAENIAAAYEMACDVDIHIGYPTTMNDDDATRDTMRVLRDLIGAEQVVEMTEPVMGAEDFSYVLERYPGTFAFLGCAPEGIDLATAPTCHSNRLVVNESAFATGVAAHAAVAFSFLTENEAAA